MRRLEYYCNTLVTILLNTLVTILLNTSDPPSGPHDDMHIPGCLALLSRAPPRPPPPLSPPPVLASVQDPESLNAGDGLVGDSVPLQVLVYAFSAAYGPTANGAIMLHTMAVMGTFLCTLFWHMAISRKLYAMARDDLAPFSTYLSHISRSKKPTRALTVVSLLQVGW